MSDLHADLVAQYKRALEEHRAAQKVEADTARTAKAAELAVLEFEGRGHTVDACWIRAWLARDLSECDRLLRLKYPEQATIERPATDEEREAFRAQAELMDHAPENGRAPADDSNSEPANEAERRLIVVGGESGRAS